MVDFFNYYFLNTRLTDCVCDRVIIGIHAFQARRGLQRNSMDPAPRSASSRAVIELVFMLLNLKLNKCLPGYASLAACSVVTSS